MKLSTANKIFGSIVVLACYAAAWHENIGFSYFGTKVGRSLVDCQIIDTRFQIHALQFRSEGWWVKGCPMFPKL